MKTCLPACIAAFAVLLQLSGCNSGQNKGQTNEKVLKGDGSDDFVYKPPKTASSSSSATKQEKDPTSKANKRDK